MRFSFLKAICSTVFRNWWKALKCTENQTAFHQCLCWWKMLWLCALRGQGRFVCVSRGIKIQNTWICEAWGILGARGVGVWNSLLKHCAWRTMLNGGWFSDLYEMWRVWDVGWGCTMVFVCMSSKKDVKYSFKICSLLFWLCRVPFICRLLKFKGTFLLCRTCTCF